MEQLEQNRTKDQKLQTLTNQFACLPWNGPIGSINKVHICIQFSEQFHSFIALIQVATLITFL